MLKLCICWFLHECKFNYPSCKMHLKSLILSKAISITYHYSRYFSFITRHSNKSSLGQIMCDHHLWPVQFCRTFRNYTIFGKKLLHVKCILLLSVTFTEIFLFSGGIIRGGTITNVFSSSCEVPDTPIHAKLGPYSFISLKTCNFS